MAIFYSKKQDGTMDVMVTGSVSQEAQLASNGKTVRFSVCYGKKKYMNCAVWANGPLADLVGRLEKHDVVMVSGEYQKWEYNGKNYSNVTADYVGIAGAGSVATPAMPNSTSTPPNDDGGEFAELDDSDGDLPF